MEKRIESLRPIKFHGSSGGSCGNPGTCGSSGMGPNPGSWFCEEEEGFDLVLVIWTEFSTLWKTSGNDDEVAEEKGSGVDDADDKIGFFDGYDCATALPGGSNKSINCR